MRVRRRLTFAVVPALMVMMHGCASAPDGSRADAPAPDATGAEAPATEAALDAAAASGTCVTGTVILEGVQVAPRTWARSSTGVYVELAGPRVANVRLLSGTVVRVCGPDPEPEAALEAEDVELLEVDGMPALLGTLREVAAGWAVEPLVGGEPVLLRDAPEAFTDAAGRVVWVAGEPGGDGFAVRSYGVLEGWR